MATLKETIKTASQEVPQTGIGQMCNFILNDLKIDWQKVDYEIRCICFI